MLKLVKKRYDSVNLEIDFEKAYDSVNWKYLEFMLQKMGFPEKCIKWMRASIFSSTMSVLRWVKDSFSGIP